MGGHLVIAGGNITNYEIYREFIKLAGGKDAKIAIVPTAATEVNRAFIMTSDIFLSLGIKRENIISVRIDPDAEGTGEWWKSGDEYKDLGFMNSVKGVWFTGGDQIRIARGFLKNDGTDTTLLKEMKNILKAGGVIGGSSAGAAIMSEIMIGGGTSYGALSMPQCKDYIEYMKKPDNEEKGVLLITPGLGFLRGGIVDQHFEERTRVGRLLEAMFSEKVNLGYGVSEDTAMIYDLKEQIIRVIGSGKITLVDISGAQRNKIGSYSRISNVNISYLVEGDSYNIREDSYYVTLKDGKEGMEEYLPKSCITNILCPYNSFLGSNKHRPNMDIKGMDYEVRIYEGKGYYKKNNSFIKAVMDIIPVFMKEEELKEAE